MSDLVIVWTKGVEARGLAPFSLLAIVEAFVREKYARRIPIKAV